MIRRLLVLPVLVFALFVTGCKSNSSGTSAVAGTGSGLMSVSLTDAPAFGYDHVWVTVRDLWFHTSSSAETEQPGWVKFPLSAPVTIDLLSLSNGVISAPVWNDIELPEGDYTQMRVFLARTEAPLTASAAAEQPSLQFNNQVDITDANGSRHYPLRVPEAERGIVLTGEFTVKKNEKLKLAVDFDAGEDIVEVERNGQTEFLLKPRLAYFDLDNAGAIVGRIDAAAAANGPAGRFVFKAEQLSPDGKVHVVRRVTALADPTGKFVLYPLAPGSYDIVMRGINYETVIVQGVPVTKGTTPLSSPTLLPTVTMTPAAAPDYALDATIESPTGAWIDFFQALPGDPAPYEIRFRHFNPLTGRIIGFLMSSDPLQVGAYDAANIALSSVTPVEGNGGYRALAGAPLFSFSLSPTVITASTGTLAYGTLNVTPPATARSVAGTVVVPESFAVGAVDRGIVFACHGGMIVNAVNLDLATSGTYTIGDLPGGTADRPLPGARYGIEAIAWSTTSPGLKAAAIPQPADLTAADETGVDLTLVMLP